VAVNEAKTISPEILNITEAIKAAVPAERIYLFGSHAYGTPHEDSDYDFFIIMPDGGLHPLDAARTVRMALAYNSRRTPVDILANYRSRFDDLARLPTLERRVAQEGVLLYESR